MQYLVNHLDSANTENEDFTTPSTPQTSEIIKNQIYSITRTVSGYLSPNVCLHVTISLL